ncbi:hypothetical protein FA15DRAFT_567760, partial [Coprinopsis marcescibilis]
AQSCTIFSSFDLPLVQFQHPKDVLWHMTQHLKFWTKPMWIIPIHCQIPDWHWTVSTVNVHRWEIIIFKS